MSEKTRRALSAAGIALFLASLLAGNGGAQQPGPRTTAAASAPPQYHPGIDVLDYDISIALPDTGRVIEGRAVLTIHRTERVDTLVLDLLHLRVDSVLVAG